jgi:S-adenosylmethionine:tRNA ribosyltransferase-isomerase
MTRLKTSDFHYRLPSFLVAQEPLQRRETSRLFVYHANEDRVEHRRFADIGDYCNGPALLVLNDTKVIPARLVGRKKTTGGRVEILLVTETGGGIWECLCKPAARLREGTEVVFPGSLLRAQVVEKGRYGTHGVLFGGVKDFWSELHKIGRVPLPPYIKRNAESRVSDVEADRERYQTVYARRSGAVAAPTAGLHFSDELLRTLERKGMEIVYLTLHVGPGTFLPVKREFVADHRLHSEYFEITHEAAERINEAERHGRQVVVVGTTAARALESVADKRGRVMAKEGWTELFIYPPYRFKLVRNLLTNFHLPCSTLLMLVAALVGREKILELYEIAKEEGYRFYSYGDAMLILQ